MHFPFQRLHLKTIYKDHQQNHEEISTIHFEQANSNSESIQDSKFSLKHTRHLMLGITEQERNGDPHRLKRVEKFHFLLKTDLRGD